MSKTSSANQQQRLWWGLLAAWLWMASSLSAVCAAALSLNHIHARDDQTAGSVNGTDTSDGLTLAAAGYSIYASSVIVAIASIGIGGFLTFFGFKLYRPTIFIVGMLFGTAIGYLILTRVEPPGLYPSREWVLLFGPLGVGVLCGCLLLCLRSVAVKLIGAALGVIVAFWVLGLRNGALIQSDWGRLVFIAICIILGMIVAHFVEREMIIIGTSVLGSYFVMFGIDLFAQTGFSQIVQRTLGGGAIQLNTFKADGKVIAMSIAFIVLALVGIIVQNRTNKKGSQFGK